MSDATETNPPNDYLKLDKARWNPNPSRALGTPANGELTGGLNIANTSGESCPGYYRYKICDYIIGTEIIKCEVSYDRGDWGTARLLWTIERVALAWKTWGRNPRIGVGHMSLEGGKEFWSEINPGLLAHQEHRNGLSVDVRYVRVDHTEQTVSCANIGDVDLQSTADLISLFLVSRFTRRILLDSRLGIPAGMYRDGSPDPNGDVQVIHDNAVHFNHFHVDVWDPDGTTN